MIIANEDETGMLCIQVLSSAGRKKKILPHKNNDCVISLFVEKLLLLLGTAYVGTWQFSTLAINDDKTSLLKGHC